MWAPSGDQLGQSSSARWLVTSCTLPSVFMSQMSRWPSRRSLTKAILAGIGANGAAVSRQPASAAPPATSETVNGSKDFIDQLLVSRPDEATPDATQLPFRPLISPLFDRSIETKRYVAALVVPTRAPHTPSGSGHGFRSLHCTNLGLFCSS